MSWTYQELLLLTAHLILAFTAILIVPKNRNPDAANAWLIVIFVFPLVGLPLYLMIGYPWLSRHRRDAVTKLRRAIERIRKSNPPPDLELDVDLGALETLARNLGGFSARSQNKIEFLDGYENILDSIVKDIEGAKHHVHCLYYIFVEDQTSRRVIDALIAAAKRGVTVRVLVDAIGSSSSLFSLLPYLNEHGVKAEGNFSLSLLRWRASRIDLRNHRKICIIDGQIGHTGSLNIVRPDPKKSLRFHELNVRCEGPSVLALQGVFLADWYSATDEELTGEEYFSLIPADDPGVIVQILPSGPALAGRSNLSVINNLLYLAEKRIIITTPYFIPDGSLLMALKTAAARGVPVDLIVSKKTDQHVVWYAQRSFYSELLESDIRVHQHTKAFLHSKCISIDGKICLVGSSNFDIRSFTLNEEISMICYDEEKAAELTAIQLSYLEGCVTLNQSRWERRRLIHKFAENASRLVSPLL